MIEFQLLKSDGGLPGLLNLKLSSGSKAGRLLRMISLMRDLLVTYMLLPENQYLSFLIEMMQYPQRVHILFVPPKSLIYKRIDLYFPILAA